jgi:hypothetical protein
MTRINLGSGRWFDTDSAECFGEDTRFDGRNHISVATGSQWEHEELYRTRTGRWILHEWSQWQGSRAYYSEVSDARAKEWLINQDHADAAERFFPGSMAASEI